MYKRVIRLLTVLAGSVLLLLILTAQRKEPEMKIVVSIEQRWLWVIQGSDTLVSAAAAVGMNQDFCYAGRCWHFDTPRGKHRVLKKVVDPVWTIPDWLYYEQAKSRGMGIVLAKPGKKYRIHDDFLVDLEIRGGELGWVNVNGAFYAPDGEHFMIYDNTIFIPPLPDPKHGIAGLQRQVHDALGPYALYLGDGYYIHGTNDFDANSIGRAVSHGCVRLDNEVVTKVYNLVPDGTPVYII